ncbi:MAG: hypothetical protein ACI9UV_000900 [Algoriphagus sp.]|jgi:hypothetical protein
MTVFQLLVIDEPIWSVLHKQGEELMTNPLLLKKE